MIVVVPDSADQRLSWDGGGLPYERIGERFDFPAKATGDQPAGAIARELLDGGRELRRAVEGRVRGAEET